MSLKLIAPSVPFLFHIMPKMIMSLKKLGTLAVMVEVRTKLIEEIEKINVSDLSHHIKSNSLIYKRNFVLLSQLKDNLDTIRQHLNTKLDDNSRWIKILGNIYNEVDHYVILYDTSFGDHFWEYHDETLCNCWLDTKNRLTREFIAIRQRLLGPI